MSGKVVSQKTKCLKRSSKTGKCIRKRVRTVRKVVVGSSSPITPPFQSASMGTQTALDIVHARSDSSVLHHASKKRRGKSRAHRSRTHQTHTSLSHSPASGAHRSRTHQTPTSTSLSHSPAPGAPRKKSKKRGSPVRSPTGTPLQRDTSSLVRSAVRKMP